MIKKIMMLAMSIASRGIDNKRIDLATKQLRHVSCHGLDNIIPCHNLVKSKKSNFYYCNGCGCGDHEHTWLEREEGKYSKLDYPVLNCPLNMPGFTNYDPNSPKDSLERKRAIEDLDPEKLKFVQITVSVDLEKEELFEKIQQIKNS